MIEIVKLYSRPELRDNPHKLFVFGDNFERKGYGGQAQAARDEPNAIGIATKIGPGQFLDDTYLSECLVREFLPKFTLLKTHTASGGTIVWPADGIGSGLAALEEKAPKIWLALARMRTWLFKDEEVVYVGDTPEVDGVVPPKV